MLSCGIHIRPQHCHQLYDHSKMQCEHVMESKCQKGHVQNFKCHANPPGTCRTCEREAKRRQTELEAELDRQAKRDQAQAEHAAAMAELDQQIRLVREEVADRRAAEERTQALQQKKRDLITAERVAEQNPNTSPKMTRILTAWESSHFISAPSPIPKPHSAQEQEEAVSKDSNEVKDVRSGPEKEWDRQKRTDGASNDAIDIVPFISVATNQIFAKLRSRTPLFFLVGPPPKVGEACGT
jgi:DNA repair exonuclease SbcCD ATPase subunit